MTHSYEYPRAALTVDWAVFRLDQADLKVRLIQRQLVPFRHTWPLPSGSSSTSCTRGQRQDPTCILKMLHVGGLGRCSLLSATKCSSRLRRAARASRRRQHVRTTAHQPAP